MCSTCDSQITFEIFLPKMHTFQLMMKKIADKQIQETVYKITIKKEKKTVEGRKITLNIIIYRTKVPVKK